MVVEWYIRTKLSEDHSYCLTAFHWPKYEPLSKSFPNAPCK